MQQTKLSSSACRSPLLHMDIGLRQIKNINIFL